VALGARLEERGELVAGVVNHPSAGLSLKHSREVDPRSTERGRANGPKTRIIFGNVSSWKRAQLAAHFKRPLFVAML